MSLHLMKTHRDVCFKCGRSGLEIVADSVFECDGVGPDRREWIRSGNFVSEMIPPRSRR